MRSEDKSQSLVGIQPQKGHSQKKMEKDGASLVPQEHPRGTRDSGWHQSLGCSLRNFVGMGFPRSCSPGEALLGFSWILGIGKEGRRAIPIGGAPRRTRQGCRAVECPIPEFRRWEETEEKEERDDYGHTEHRDELPRKGGSVGKKYWKNAFIPSNPTFPGNVARVFPSSSPGFWDLRLQGPPQHSGSCSLSLPGVFRDPSSWFSLGSVPRDAQG